MVRWNDGLELRKDVELQVNGVVCPTREDLCHRRLLRDSLTGTNTLERPRIILPTKSQLLRQTFADEIPLRAAIQ